ncbi:MAG: ATP-binding protein [Spirochaetales bacterium]|nr:ATP-binding protein [Spirochaetales bacterium]
MVLLNEDLVISYMNRSTVEITGAAASNSIGLNIKDLKIFNELFKTTPEELFSEEDYNVYRNESVELPAMGRIQYYRYTIYKLLGGDDKLNYLLSVENITEHEREKQAIFEVEKNKTLNTLIASIAHEIKNPLMSIYNYSVLIPRQMKNAEFRESFVNTVPEEVNRIRRLIDSLINYAKPAKGQREYLNLLPVVKDCIRLTRPSTEKKGIDVTVDVEDNLIIYMDKDKLKQCLVNLIINSMDSIVQKNETGGKAVSGIRIEGIKAESYTGISVSDDGCGMTEDELENCISPFYTTKQKGTGLGISIIKRIVEDNGGEIIIESKKDQYTKVTLKFY